MFFDQGHSVSWSISPCPPLSHCQPTNLPSHNVKILRINTNEWLKEKTLNVLKGTWKLFTLKFKKTQINWICEKLSLFNFLQRLLVEQKASNASLSITSLYISQQFLVLFPQKNFSNIITLPLKIFVPFVQGKIMRLKVTLSSKPKIGWCAKIAKCFSIC